VSKRLDDDISAVCAAFNLSIENGVVSGVRVAFGGMAAIPKRARACEAAPARQALEPGHRRACLPGPGRDFTPLSDFRASQSTAC
jgi:xanthine dehydrogenase small subunit